ncbi:CsbD family protein [Enterovirga sp.]|uniref:CsbD family protein n=1 Tax=Enterovirga sp. TaxID=2026350 RepID=UPI002C078118|nr:CsbD family protein [Enterovirga sp.]HMO31299.1 CsbD family protein [Enterovirga sp.]
MSGTTDKIKGMANEAAGNVKQGLGKLTGDERLRAEGLAQEAKGDAQQAVGDLKNKIKDAAGKNL